MFAAIAVMLGLMSVPAHANHRGTCSTHRCLRHARFLCHKHAVCRDRVLIAHMGVKGIAFKILIARGDRDQWPCLDQLWEHESGWQVHIPNQQGSGAYGIPQALPGSRMGPGWQDDATVQIRWGIGYIYERYHSPCGAWAKWQARSPHWY